jgi:hypothetical protein
VKRRAQASWMTALLIALLPAATTWGQTPSRPNDAKLPGYVIERVADTQTPVPDGTGDFIGLGVPSIHGGTVAFKAVGVAGQKGVYALIGGALTRVADLNTAIPGGTGNFTDFPSVSVSSEGSVAFIGWGQAGHRGVYTNQGGSLSVLVDDSFAVPGNPGATFGNFFAIAYDGGQVAFSGVSDGFVQGVYLANGVAASVVADTNTHIPRGIGNFTDLGLSSSAGWPSLHGGDVAFIGAGDRNQSGVYARIGGVLQVIADRFTLIPGTSTRFGRFNDSSRKGVAIRDSEVAFQNDGVYVRRASGLATVADFGTPVPGGLGLLFSQFGPPAIDHGRVAFGGGNFYVDPFSGGELPIVAGVYTDLQGPVRGLVARWLLSLLEGKQVTSFFSDTEGLSDGIFAFTATFDDGSSGVYIARPQ